jgi:hypothetical protein
MATINGTFNSLIAGTLSGTIGTPGPQGLPGGQGPVGPVGPGVPAGGTAGQFLTKTTTGVDYATNWTTLSLAGYATESWVTAGFYPLTGNPSAFLVAADLNGYATETYVNSQGFITASALTPYLPKSGGAMTGSITSSSATYDTEMAGDLFGVQLSADHSKGTTVQFNGLDTYDGASHMLVTPTGLTFPDATVQTTAATSGLITSVTAPLAVTSGDLSIDLTGYATESFVTGQGYITQGTADGLYYSISNPSGFITSGDLAGYATESFVTSQGYITASALTGYATESWVQSQGYLYPDANGVIQYPNGVMTDPAFPVGRFWYQSQKFRWTDGVAIRTVASESWVSNAYAPLSGATFTGKIILTPGSTIAPLNIGTGYTPASTTAGDVWMGTNTISYKDGANLVRTLSVNGLTNAFSAPQIIDTTATTAALRVTQKGTGNAIEVEDSTSPDATRFVVDQFGKVGVGTAPDATAAIKLDGNGISFNGLVFNPTATSAHTGGSDTLDLLVTINGTNYRLGLRPA